jgi:acetyl/propionyl-CoA carboxylase alpha subunit
MKVNLGNSEVYDVVVGNDGKASVNGREVLLDIASVGKSRHHLLINGMSFDLEIAEVDSASGSIAFYLNGELVRAEIIDRMGELLQRLGMDKSQARVETVVKAPMPGLVLDVIAQPGQSVESGSPLVILEAMKMENVIKSAAAGTIKKVYATKGSTVEKNAVLVEFEDE